MTSGKTILYLDWNTLSGLKSPKTASLKALDKLIETYEDDLIIPYSPSHLADLNKDYKNNKIQINKDLQYLKLKTKDIVIAKYFGQNETVLEKRDLLDFFDEILSEESNRSTTSQSFEDSTSELRTKLNPILEKIDFSSILPTKDELEKSEAGRRFLKQFPQFMETGNLWSIAKDLANQTDLFKKDPNEFNKLRKGLAQDLRLDPDISNWSPAIEKLDKYLSSTFIGKSFSKIIYEDVTRFHKDPVFYDFYISAYNHLGLFGFRPDKLTQKNRFTNSIEDANHSYYGAVSNCFITSEKVMYYRSKALFEAFAINSKLYNTFEVDKFPNICSELKTEIKKLRLT